MSMDFLLEKMCAFSFSMLFSRANSLLEQARASPASLRKLECSV